MDGLVIIITLFSLAVAVTISFVLFSQIRADGALATTPEGATMIENVNDAYLVWDNIFLAVFVGLALSSIIGAAVARSSPLFFFFSVILLAIVVLVGMVVSQTFEDMTEDTQFDASKVAFPKLFYIMQNIGLLVVIIGFLIAIALYSVRGSGGIV